LVSSVLNPGDVIKIYEGSTFIGNVRDVQTMIWQDEMGSGVLPFPSGWSFQLPQTSDGTHIYTAQIVNAAGVSVAKSADFSLTVDTIAPDKPTFEAVDSVDVLTGPIGPGSSTDDSQPVFRGNSGSSEAGTVITVHDVDDGTSSVLGSTAVQADGAWSFRPTKEMDDGQHSVTVKATDQAGNESVASDALAFKLDTSSSDHLIDGVVPSSSTVESTSGNDIVTLDANHDTLLYKLLAPSDATGGNGADQIKGFTVGVYGETPHASRIDLLQLLTGYTPKAADGPAHVVAGKATIDAGDSIGDYLKVKTENGNTVISIDRDGAGAAFSETPLLTLHGVSTDLATLLADQQIVVSHG
jgi:hypothetical protein